MPVAGAVVAARQHQTAVILTGDEEKLRVELERQNATDLLDNLLEIRHAPEVVEMDEKPAQAARRKKQSSIRIALDLVKNGEAQAMVSAGNSGAVVATALLSLGRIKGVLRPAIASSIPGVNGRTVVLDLGAITEVEPEHLVQWALVGGVYAAQVEERKNPKLGVLSNGEEDAKGTDLTRGANALLKTVEGINYSGYAEGRDVLIGDFDVIVTDGFTGNVLLKALEGSGKYVSQFFRKAYATGFWRKLGYLFSKSVFEELRYIADYRNYGGAPLLGVNGAVIIAHGGSDHKAMANAIRQAKHHVDVGLNQAIAQTVTDHADLFKKQVKTSAAS